MTLGASALKRYALLMLLLLVSGGSTARAEQAFRIFFAEAPGLLVQVDGEPVYASIPETGLERVTNTTAFIVRDSSGLYYLRLRDGWMQSYQLRGNWSASGVSPFGENTATENTLAAASEGPTTRLEIGSATPTIFVVTERAALIVTDGPPRYATVAGTELQYLANTPAKVFREPTDQEFYVRVDGQWYRAWTIDGEWEIVAANDLPRDIAIAIAR